MRAPVTAIGATAVMLWLADGLGMRTSSGSIEVAIDPQTFVHPRGTDVQGDTSALQVGDVLSIGTAYEDSGQRTAAWIVANMQLVDLQVTGTEGTDVLGTVMQQQLTSTELTARCTVPTSAAAVLGSVAGDYWNLICSRDIEAARKCTYGSLPQGSTSLIRCRQPQMLARCDSPSQYLLLKGR